MVAMKSNGQSRAIDELLRIEQIAGSQLKVDYIQEPTGEEEYLLVEVSFRCDSYEHIRGGLKYKNRETVQIFIPWQFPMRYQVYGYLTPDLMVSHTFNGKDIFAYTNLQTLSGDLKLVCSASCEELIRGSKMLH